jgi:hypothetical protein
MMSKRMFSVTKGARLVTVLFALLLVLAVLQAFSARSAEAGPNLVQGQVGGQPDTATFCPLPYPGKSPTALNWTGTDADDTKCGSDYADYMNGAGGSDTLYGLYGNNTLTGGTGNDLLFGSFTEPDQINPGDGQDLVYAGGANDTITLNADGQIDSISGGSGTDLVRVTSCGGLDSVDQLNSIELMSRPSC